MSKKNTVRTTIVSVLLFVVGLSLVLYPSFADYINSLHQSRVISNYQSSVAAMSKEDYTEAWEAARQFNEDMQLRPIQTYLSEEENERYNSLLNVNGNGQMGYIEIPSINLKISIKHGTSDMVLQDSIGHIEWSSLPVGGEGSHCVLSGHRGLPSAKLFSNLDRMKEGDIFLLRIMDEVLTYRVYKIEEVLPDDVSQTLIVPGKDICTLLTCTPYGINTHRLLVHGYRIETTEEVLQQSVAITSEMIQVEELIVAGVIIICMLTAMMITALLKRNKKRSVVGDVRDVQDALMKMKKRK